MQIQFEKRKDFTVQEVWDMLYKNGASKDPKAPIRIWDYGQLVPNNKFLNQMKKIGQGGYGSVYVIQIEGLDYALKIMTQKRGETQQALIDNFYNECKQLLSVNHQRVLRIIGIAIDTQEEGDYCFCHYTNYQQKGNLYEIIKKNWLFNEVPKGSKTRFFKKIKILSQIAEGIHAIHAVGLVHRDIKSLNVLIDDNDAPKIADLGLAGEWQQSFTSKTKGTGAWMAPELFENKVYYESDIWALACVAIEIFNETAPYPQLQEFSQIRQYVYEQRGIPNFSPELQQERMLTQLLLDCFK